MKIETKYDIGQEVWYIAPAYEVEEATQGSISDIEIQISKEINSINYMLVGGIVITKHYKLYPTKEACEQAIKEME
jgi:hypothetical protein